MKKYVKIIAIITVVFSILSIMIASAICLKNTDKDMYGHYRTKPATSMFDCETKRG